MREADLGQNAEQRQLSILGRGDLIDEYGTPLVSAGLITRGLAYILKSNYHARPNKTPLFSIGNGAVDPSTTKATGAGLVALGGYFALSELTSKRKMTRRKFLLKSIAALGGFVFTQTMNMTENKADTTSTSETPGQ